MEHKRPRVASQRLKESLLDVLDDGPDEVVPPPSKPRAKKARSVPASVGKGNGEGHEAKEEGSGTGVEDALADLKAWIAQKYPESPLADPTTVDVALTGWSVFDKPRPTGRHVDRYYVTTTGKHLRSRPEVSRHLGLLKDTDGGSAKAPSEAAAKPKPPPPRPTPAPAAGVSSYAGMSSEIAAPDPPPDECDSGDEEPYNPYDNDVL